VYFDLHDALGTALLASGMAGKKILSVYNSDFSNTLSLKSDHSPLTLADTVSNEIICGMLIKQFPDIPILSEEGRHPVPLDAEYCWIVDPLDGTKEFIKQNGEFTVNIGLAKEHRPVLGVVAVPVTGEVFFAAKGYGAFSRHNSTTQPIHVSAKTNELIWVGSKSHSTEKEQNLIKWKRGMIREIISAGSSLKGIMVAAGRADVYYRFGPTCEWDTCAMHCIAEEAGGICRQMDGSELLYNRENHLNEKGFYIVNRPENVWT
jgi:3'(2'), 5'-bisphosphate nucleotidase